jgi:hypothetical protein
MIEKCNEGCRIVSFDVTSVNVTVFQLDQNVAVFSFNHLEMFISE